MAKISRVCEILDVSLEKSNIRRKPTTNTKAGFVQSHVKAFSASGDGETLIENAVENEARVNRDMTPEEEERLRSLAERPRKVAASPRTQ